MFAPRWIDKSENFAKTIWKKELNYRNGPEMCGIASKQIKTRIKSFATRLFAVFFSFLIFFSGIQKVSVAIILRLFSSSAIYCY